MRTRGKALQLLVVLAIVPAWLALAVHAQEAAKAAKAPKRTVNLAAPVLDTAPDPDNPGKQLLKASGGVVMTTAELTLKAAQATATLGKKGGIERVVATGGVAIKGSRKMKDGVEQRLDATSDEAAYLLPEKQLTLSGNVRGTLVEVERDWTWDLTAQRAIMWLDEDRVRLEKAAVTITMPEKAEKTESK